MMSDFRLFARRFSLFFSRAEQKKSTTLLSHAPGGFLAFVFWLVAKRFFSTLMAPGDAGPLFRRRLWEFFPMV